MKRKHYLFISILFFVMNISAQDISVIPRPAEISVRNGSFILDKDCGLQYDKTNEEVARIANFFNEYLDKLYGFKLDEDSKENPVQFKIISQLQLGKEGYLLKVNPNSVVITASAPNGLFYGMQTLKQMLPVDAEDGKLSLTTIDIKDQPRFVWRGNMLDAGRHFFPVSFIKKYIDILASYKINTFHWHLTEDQG